VLATSAVAAAFKDALTFNFSPWEQPMHYLRYSVYLFAIILLAPMAHSAGVPFPALQFLLGNWQVESKPGEATAHFEFVLDLQGKVIVRHNHIEYPQGARHDDLVVVSQEGATTRGYYFDSDGYSGRYSITANGAQVIFTSEPIPKLPRYRLTYTALPDGRLNAKLEVAPAGKPNAFASYLDWVASKTNSNASATPTPAKP
jgi:hypothetical protein